MYLAKEIDEVLESKKSRLLGRPTYFYICDVLTRGFKKIEPYKFRYETYDDFGKDDYSVAGLYDMETDVKYVILNFSKDSKAFYLTDKNWRDFKFSISQVCQHEKIHQCQWQHKDVSDYEHEPLEFRNKNESKEEEQDYLLDPDEIDAYGHDIAMEIKYFYPKKNPYDVLRSLNRHKKLWSYKYYRETFKGEDWSDIKNSLYKKIYKWMPYVTV